MMKAEFERRDRASVRVVREGGKEQVGRLGGDRVGDHMSSRERDTERAALD